MGAKYKAKFTDIDDVYTWELDVIDVNYTSYSSRVQADGGGVEALGCINQTIFALYEYKELSLARDGFGLEYGQRGDDPFKPIKGSKLDLTFFAQDADDLAFIEQVAQTQEQRYYIDIYRNGSLFWRGGVLQDLLRVPYSSLPIPIQLQATCGLARLQKIKEAFDYDNILEAIIDILRTLDEDNLYSSTDPFLLTAVRWFETQMFSSSPSAGLDPLAQTRLEALNTQYTVEQNGTAVYRSMYEWLEVVLGAFGARIFMADGRWNIIQVTEYEHNNSVYNLYERGYSYTSGNPSSTATGIDLTNVSLTTYYELSGTASFNRIMPGSEYGYLPALRKVSLVRDIRDGNIATAGRLEAPDVWEQVANIAQVYNLVQNSDEPLTQNITVRNVAHTIYFINNAATITLSGASTGVITQAMTPYTFTPSAGTLTLTMSTSPRPEKVQLSEGSAALPYARTPGLSFEFVNRMTYHKIVNATASHENFHLEITVSIRVTNGSNVFYLAPSSNNTQFYWITAASTIRTLFMPYQGIDANTVGFWPTQLGYQAWLNAGIGLTFVAQGPPINGLLEVKYNINLYTAVPGAQMVPHPNLSVGTITTGDGPPNGAPLYFNDRGLIYGFNYNNIFSVYDKVTYDQENTTILTASVEKELPSVWVGDIAGAGTFEVWSDTEANWVPSQVWQVRGSGTQRAILATVVSKYMGQFDSPKRLFDFTIRGVLNPLRAMEFRNLRYLWNYLKLDAMPATVSSEAFEITPVPTSYDGQLTLPPQRTPLGDVGGSFNKVFFTEGNVNDDVSFIDADEVSGTVTSVTVSALPTDLGYKGQAITFQRTDGQVIRAVLSSNALKGATSISIESTSLTLPLTRGTLVQKSTSETSQNSYAVKLFDILRYPEAKCLLLEESGSFGGTPSAIADWPDYSGNLNSFAATSVAITENGKFWAEFDGLASGLDNSSIDISQPFSLIMALYRIEANTGRYIIASDGSSGKVLEIYTAAGNDATIKVGATTATINLPRDVWSILQVQFNGASSKWRLNGESWFSITLGSDTIKHPSIGYDGSTNYCEMRLAAVCIFGRILSDEEFEGVFINLKSRI